MDQFNYDVPYMGFSDDLAEEDIRKAEEFFNTEHASHNILALHNLSRSCDEETEIAQEFFTPLNLKPDEEDAEESVPVILRKSLSTSNLPTSTKEAETDPTTGISEAMKSLTISSARKKSARKSHHMKTRGDVPKLNLRSRSVSRENIEKQTKPKQRSNGELESRKYISMAEAITLFHQKTPTRFRTKSKLENFPVMKPYKPIVSTLARSPALATKQRARTTHVLSREEQELKEFNEAKKFEIKAHPVNMKILNGPIPLKVNVVKKPPTKLEPFKITEVPVKKVPTSQTPVPEFHAKPVPKSVLEPPKPIIKSQLCTRPHTPKFMRKLALQKSNESIMEVDNGQSAAPKPFKPTRTILAPFSFDDRDKGLIKKKEQLLNEILEEERKAREFHAQPLPKRIFKSPQPQSKYSFTSHLRQRSDDSLMMRSNESMLDTTVNTFKARPAKVLQMKPFVPKKEDRQLTEITQFQLNTERRAKEREEFELKVKRRDECFSQCKKLNEEENLRQEEEEVVKLRKEMEFKAQPIRRYKEVKVVSTNKVTIPMSPKFVCDSVRNKENL